MLFLVLITSVFSFKLTSQNIFKSGLLLGITASQYDGDGYAGYKKAGLTAGFYSRVKTGDHTHLQLEISYFMKGARKIPDPNKNDLNQYLLDLDYVDIPLLFRMEFEKRHLLAELGSGIGILVRVREENNYLDITGRRPFNRTEIPFHSGLGYYLSNGWEVILRYSYSIIPVRPHPSGKSVWFNRGEFNNSLSFSVRKTFGKKAETI